MPDFIDFNIVVAAIVVAFIVGVLVSTKVKDWVAGVPASLRSELNTLETSVKAQVKTAQAAVVADVKSKVVIPVPVLATAKSATVAVTGATGS